MTTKTKSLILPAVILLSCLLTGPAFSQTNNAKLTKLYVQGGLGKANHVGGSQELAVQGVINDRWTVGVSLQRVRMAAKNIPEDFDPGSGTVFFIPIPGERPGIELKMMSLTAGRFFKTGKNSWLTTEAGLSIVGGQKLTFTKDTYEETLYNPFYFLFGISGTPANYEISQEQKTSIGAMLKVDYNWAFASWMGVGVGAFANFNSIQSPIGIQLKLLVGKMGRK